MKYFFFWFLTLANLFATFFCIKEVVKWERMFGWTFPAVAIYTVLAIGNFYWVLTAPGRYQRMKDFDARMRFLD